MMATPLLGVPLLLGWKARLIDGLSTLFAAPCPGRVWGLSQNGTSTDSNGHLRHGTPAGAVLAPGFAGSHLPR